MSVDPRQIAAALTARSADIITTSRGQQHGELESSFTLIAEWWNSYINHRLRATEPAVPNFRVKIDAVDVLELMAMVKKARNLYGSSIPDHTVDDIGYTSLAGGLRLQNSVGKETMREVEEAMKKRADVQAQAQNAVAAAVARDAGIVQPVVADEEPPAPTFLKDKKKA